VKFVRVLLLERDAVLLAAKIKVRVQPPVASLAGGVSLGGAATTHPPCVQSFAFDSATRPKKREAAYTPIARSLSSHTLRLQ